MVNGTVFNQNLQRAYSQLPLRIAEHGQVTVLLLGLELQEPQDGVDAGEAGRLAHIIEDDKQVAQPTALRLELLAEVSKVLHHSNRAIIFTYCQAPGRLLRAVRPQ